MSRMKRLKALEAVAKRREHPRRVYLRKLLDYLEVKKQARLTGDAIKEQEAAERRGEVEALAHEIEENGW